MRLNNRCLQRQIAMMIVNFHLPFLHTIHVFHNRISSPSWQWQHHHPLDNDNFSTDCNNDGKFSSAFFAPDSCGPQQNIINLLTMKTSSPSWQWQWSQLEQCCAEHEQNRIRTRAVKWDQRFCTTNGKHKFRWWRSAFICFFLHRIHAACSTTEH